MCMHTLEGSGSILVGRCSVVVVVVAVAEGSSIVAGANI